MCCGVTPVSSERPRYTPTAPGRRQAEAEAIYQLLKLKNEELKAEAATTLPAGEFADGEEELQ